MLARYAESLDWALASKGLVMLILLGVIALNAYLFYVVPKSLFPQQDTGQLAGGLSADQSISSKAMGEKLRQVVNIVRADPAVDTVVGFTGGARAGGGFMFVTLKPVSERSDKGLAVIARLRPQAGAGRRPAAVPEPGAGFPLRRPPEQLHLPVHAQGREQRDPAPVVGQAAARR